MFTQQLIQSDTDINRFMICWPSNDLLLPPPDTSLLPIYRLLSSNSFFAFADYTHISYFHFSCQIIFTLFKYQTNNFVFITLIAIIRFSKRSICLFWFSISFRIFLNLSTTSSRTFGNYIQIT